MKSEKKNPTKVNLMVSGRILRRGFEGKKERYYYDYNLLINMIIKVRVTN